MIKFIFGFLMMFSGCAQLTKDLMKDPDVKVMDVALQNLSNESMTINVKLNVNNPNPIPLALGKINYSLKFSGQEVTTGIFEKGVDIPASGANDLTIPLTFKFDAVKSLIDVILKKTNTKEYEFSGSAGVGLFTIPFTKKGEIELK